MEQLFEGSSFDQAVTSLNRNIGGIWTRKTRRSLEGFLPCHGAICNRVWRFSGHFRWFLGTSSFGYVFVNYRTIPATVDTVLVQSYDLIAPLTSDYIYALGLSQNNLPKITQNTSLLSDEERETLNQVTQEGSQLMIASQENLKKNRYTMLSLVNSAR